MTPFRERVQAAWDRTNSLVCVGLDPDASKLPARFARAHEPIFAFNREVIDATCDLVCAYKPQIAFYSAVGAERELEKTIEYIRQRAPQVIVILDAKRGDVGNTAAAYAREAFERYGADAVTVNAYTGGDGLHPFVADPGRGAIVLCRTSNPGARDLQDLQIDGRPLYQHVAERAARDWNEHGNVCLVVGATYPGGDGPAPARPPRHPVPRPGHRDPGRRPRGRARRRPRHPQAGPIHQLVAGDRVRRRGRGDPRGRPGAPRPDQRVEIG
jgi:orotidine-5'-phosphate decarboxylase